MVKKKLGFIILFFFITLLTFSQDVNYFEGFSVESMPVFRGNLEKFIKNQIEYPVSALKDSIEGKVFVSFWVDTLGNTTEHTIVSGIREDLNNEALRVTKLIKFKKAAMQKGKPIKVKYILKVEFKLPNRKILVPKKK
jgi:TonB family protein